MANENMQVEVIARFDKCPWCGSEQRMMGELAKEMVEQGLLSEGVDAGTHEVGGPIIDPTKAGQMLAVSYRPGMYALRDTCIGCGREITVKIERRPTEVRLGMPQGAGRTQMPPGSMNPRMGG